jgi:hypothetical protein
MNITTLFDGKTSTDVRIDGPIESTVRIPLHDGRIVWRLLCAVAVVVFSAYALVHQALDYEPRRESSVVDIIGQRDLHDVPADKREIVTKAVSYPGAVQKYTRDYGREWRIFVTVVALLTAMFTFFREMARLQSMDPGMIVAPSGLTINSEATHRIANRIAWPEIAAIEDKSYKGRASVAIKLRDPERILGGGSFFSRLTQKSGDARIVIAPGSLRIDKPDLKNLLARYFDAYGAKRTESSSARSTR